MKSIFVSHVYEDRDYLEKMRKWERNGLVDGCTFTFENEDKRIEGYDAIREYLKKKIEGAAIVLILIGENTHNHDWIRVEIELANNFNKKLCVMRIPDTKGGKPQILINYKELDFNPNQILKELK
jgi:predicted RNA binding protein with dsRBD fold (UPF0201 family)